MSVSLVKWAVDWQKDHRFSKNYTARLIEKACALDSQLETAYRNGTVTVTAGPHRKSGPNMGGDARWHLTLRPSGKSSCWHVLLNECVSRPIEISKRQHLGHIF